MAVLDPNEIFFTAFEPKQQNRFILYVDGIPAYVVKGVGAVSVTQGTVELNHINVSRYVKGKSVWDPISLTLFDPITPSGAQAVMEWVRFNVLGPVGDIVSEWIIKGAFITNAAFGEYNWDSVDTAQNIELTVQPDYCILNF